MKIAITATGNELSSEMDSRFGRARWFNIVDTETGSLATAVENVQNVNAVQGAGIQAAQRIASLDVDAVVTGNVGPKAFRTLTAAEVKIFLCQDGTVAGALEAFLSDRLEPADGANVEGHWG